MDKTLLLLLAIPALLVAYIFDVRAWRIKSRQELEEMADGQDWKRWKPALKELRRRGESIEGYVPHLVARLLSPERFTRAAARVTLIDLFPKIKAELSASGYQPLDTPEVSRQKLMAIMAQHPVGPA